MCERDSSDGGGVYRIGASLVLLAVGEEDTAVKVQTWQPARQPHDTASYLGSFPLHCGPEYKTVSMMYKLRPSFNKKLGQIRK